MYAILQSYREALTTYNRKRMRDSSVGNYKISKLLSVFELRTEDKRDNSVNSKIKQIEKLLNRCHYNNQGERFIFSLDEKRYPLLSGRVVDNMPVDYTYMTDYSLADLKKLNSSGSPVARDNLAMIDVLDRYIDKFCSYDRGNRCISYIRGIKNKKADNLEEALQRILFFNQILWQTQHTLVGLGRLDKILNRFLVPENAEQIICDFLITLHSFYNFKSSTIMGDTGQIILLGGLEEDGSYFRNRYTELFIHCIKKINLPDPKCLLRVSEKTPEYLLGIAIDCISTGVGSPLLSNDDVIIPLLIDFGYEREDAFNYGVSACWEPLAIGKSLEQNNLAHVEYGTAAGKMILDDSFISCSSFEEIRKLYNKYLTETVNMAIIKMNAIQWEPDPIQTLLTVSCIENGKDISQGGAKYNNYGILSDGLGTAVDSLLNIKHFCFDKKKFSLSDFQEAISHNYDGYEQMHDLVSMNYNGFGTESEEAINLSNAIIGETTQIISKYSNRFEGKVKFGLSSPGYISIGKKACATADGRKAGMPFATHISRDSNESITQILNFASRLNYSAFSSNANVVDIMIQPNLLIDSKGKFKQLIKSAIKMGIFQVQFNVVSYEQLVEAKAHPEKYPNLIVRVWGFSAYFKELPEGYQDQLILRAKNMEGIA